MNVQKIYQERKETNRLEENRISKKLTFLSWVRVGVFLALVIIPIYLANARQNLAFVLSLAVLLPIFFVLINKYLKLKREKQFHQFLREINEEELARLSGVLNKKELNGEEFTDSKHPYSYDLDIFGKSSLFLLLNRTTSKLGKTRLASWLQSKSDRETIVERQKAVQELSEKLDWRQDLQASGKFADGEAERTDYLLQWMEKDLGFQWAGWQKIGSKVFPLIAIASLVIYLTTDLSAWVLLVGLLGNGIIIQSTSATVTKVINEVSDCVAVLKNYAELSEQIEIQKFDAPYLNDLQKELGKGEASKAIRQLSKILYHLELRNNAWFYGLFVIWTLYDVQWLLALMQWRKQYKHQIRNWLDAISQFEALNSLAGFAFSNQDYHYPTILEESYHFEAEEIGHPLISGAVRVCNNFSLSGKGKTAIITGSNMSGKSTFERTLGLNMVLAFAGAPVCAKKLALSEFHVFTSMRTQDSLEENVSGFFAELKRIRQLLDQVESGKATFYFLDEVLKGTNSQDRHKGAKAIIKKLSHEMPAFGLITTHDLELGDLAEHNPDVAENYSFNSQIIDGNLIFNYKISTGVCHSFSASKLMERIGIQVEE